MSTTVKAWLTSLIAAGIGGGASAALSFLAMPDVFNTTPSGLKHALIATVIGMLVPVLTILKQSPLPPDTGSSSMGSKLPVWALIAILVGFTIPEAGCSGTQIAQDIVNWTPALVSAVGTVDGMVSILDPAAAPILTAATVGFDAASTLVVAQAKAYLANPNVGVLATLQNAVVNFQQSVTSSILQAARIVDVASQQKALQALNAVATIINTILGLVASIKGNTVTAPPSAVNLSMIEPYINRKQSADIISTHYGISREEAMYHVSYELSLLHSHGF